MKFQTCNENNNLILELDAHQKSKISVLITRPGGNVLQSFDMELSLESNHENQSNDFIINILNSCGVNVRLEGQKK